MKTLVTPSPQALTKLWKNSTVKVANTVDRVIVPGNLVSLLPEMKDGKKWGSNSEILRFVSTYVETHDLAEILIGPNEIVSLSNPRVWANDYSLWRLKNLWLEGSDSIARVSTVLGSRLVTHGGMTFGEWVELGRPETAYEASVLLNQKYHGVLFTNSCYSLGGPPNYAADPIFAHPFKELYPSWLTTTELAPFGQIIATRSLNSNDGREEMGDEGSPMSYLERISYRKFGSIASVAGQEITSLGGRVQNTQLKKLPKDEAYYIEATSN